MQETGFFEPVAVALASVWPLAKHTIFAVVAAALPDEPISVFLITASPVLASEHWQRRAAPTSRRTRAYRNPHPAHLEVQQ